MVYGMDLNALFGGILGVVLSVTLSFSDDFVLLVID